MTDLVCSTHGHRIVADGRGNVTQVSLPSTRKRREGMAGSPNCVCLHHGGVALQPGPQADTGKYRGCVLVPTDTDAARVLKVPGWAMPS